MTKKELAKFRRRKEKILAMIAGGYSYAGIGRRLNISRQRVQQIVNGK